MPRASVVASILALAVVCAALAFVLFFELIAEAGPVRATVITYVNPAVAAVLGVTVLSERFTVEMGVGFALVLLGSLLATRPLCVPRQAPKSRWRPNQTSAKSSGYASGRRTSAARGRNKARLS